MRIFGRRILWRNFPGRYWLWWHDGPRHAYRRLIRPVWTCSCGSSYTPPEES